MNTVILIGNVGSEPQTMNTQNGKTVTSIAMATNEKYKNQEGILVESVEWHNLIFFGNNSSNASKMLQKGSKISVRGSIHYKKYVKNNGENGIITQIIVSEFWILSPKKDVNLQS